MLNIVEVKGQLKIVNCLLFSKIIYFQLTMFKNKNEIILISYSF